MHRHAMMLTLLATAVALSRPVALPGRADEPARPTLRVRPTEDFELGGSEAAAAWKKVEPAALNRRASSVHDYKTTVKALYSKTGLYVLFEGTDASLTARFDRDFEDLWTEDVFEAFFWTDEKHPVYFEYEISPLGYELPILVPNFGGRFFGWRPWHYEGDRRTKKVVTILGGPQKSGAEIEGWQAEVFFPYELLKPLQNVPPGPGTRWLANFYRMDYDGGRTSSWDWARVGPSFHEYEKFGTLVFE